MFQGENYSLSFLVSFTKILQSRLLNIIFREQRSSSEDSLLKLLQSNPTIYEADDDEDCFAISRQSYERLNKYKTESGQSEYFVDDKSEVEQNESEDTEVCYNAEIKVISVKIWKFFMGPFSNFDECKIVQKGFWVIELILQ